MSDAVLKLTDVAQIAGDGKTLFAVDEFEVRRGEVLCIIGPNGAGKSSLLKVLGLLERPTRGELLFDGEPVSGGDVVAQRRKTATVFQEPLLYDSRVRENVAAGLKFRRIPRQQIAQRVAAALEMLGVAHLADQRALSLSGGEAQRVSLARALVLEPEVFLLDEPFSGLDPEAARKLLEDLRHLVHERRITTVFVTHDRAEALAIADRVAVMMNGKVVQVGTVEDVFAHPASSDVASFVGVETVLSGAVVSCETDSCVVEVGGSVGGTGKAGGIDVVVAHIVAGNRAEGEVFACIRPEDVTLTPPDVTLPSSARNRFVGEVTAIGPLGPHHRVEVDCGFRLVCFVTKQAAEELELREGSKVGAMFKATAVHLLSR